MALAMARDEWRTAAADDAGEGEGPGTTPRELKPSTCCVNVVTVVQL